MSTSRSLKIGAFNEIRVQEPPIRPLSYKHTKTNTSRKPRILLAVMRVPQGLPGPLTQSSLDRTLMKETPYVWKGQNDEKFHQQKRLGLGRAPPVSAAAPSAMARCTWSSTRSSCLREITGPMSLVGGSVMRPEAFDRKAPETYSPLGLVRTAPKSARQDLLQASWSSGCLRGHRIP